jgi:hypothetical protein
MIFQLLPLYFIIVRSISTVILLFIKQKHLWLKYNASIIIMFPSFSSLSDRSQKQQKLIDRLTLESQIEKVKEKAYGEAFINPDTFSLDPFKPSTSVGTQTERSTSTTTSSSGPGLNPPSRDSDESALMAAEDVRSQYLRYERRIKDANVRYVKTMQEMSNDYNLQHRLSRRENELLRRDFDLGRQLFLDLQKKYENVANSDTQNAAELADLRARYDQGEKLYFALEQAYHALLVAHNTDRADLEQLISNLTRLGAEETAKVVAAHNRIHDLEIDTNNLVQLIQNMQASHDELNQNLHRAEVAYNQLLEHNLLTKSENAGLSKLQEESTKKLNALAEQIDKLEHRDHVSESDKQKLSGKLNSANKQIDELTNRVADYKDIISTTRSSAKVGKKERSPNNTPAALLKFMIDRGVEEVPAANPKGMLSPSAKFVVKDGELFSRTGKGDKPINKLTVDTWNYIWSMIAINHQLGPGFDLINNRAYRAEYNALDKAPYHDDEEEKQSSHTRPSIIDESLPTYEENERIATGPSDSSKYSTPKNQSTDQLDVSLEASSSQ